MKRFRPFVPIRWLILKASLSLFFILCIIFQTKSQALVYGKVISGSLSAQANTASQDNLPFGLAFNNDGSKCFVAGQNTKNIFEYNLATNYDLTTASYGGSSLNVSPQLSANVTGMAFSTDGLKMYVTGRNYNLLLEINQSYVVEYVMSSAFDLTTVTSNNSLLVHSNETYVEGITFNNDGTKLFIVGSGSGKVNEYTLSTGFDLTSASASSLASVAFGTDSNYTDIEFNADGSRMYLSGSGDNQVDVFYLNIPFDVSSNVYFIDDFDPGLSPQGMAFNRDRSLFFTIGLDGLSARIKSYLLDDTESFKENSANDGSLAGQLTIYLAGGADDLFRTDGNLTYGTNYFIPGLSAGLTPVLTVSADSTTAVLTLIGNATSSDEDDNINDFIMSFSPTALKSGSLTGVLNTTNASTGASVNFINQNFDVTLTTANANATASPITVNASSNLIFTGLDAADVSVTNGIVTKILPSFSGTQKNALSGFVRAATLDGQIYARVDASNTFVVYNWEPSNGIVTDKSFGGTVTPTLYDIAKDENKNYYLLDRANKRVLILDSNYNQTAEITGFYNSNDLFRLAVNKSGTLLASINATNQITIFNKTGVVLGSISNSTVSGTTYDLCFDPEGDLVVVGYSTTADAKITVYDANNFSLKGTFEGPSTTNLSSVTANDEFLFTVNADGVVWSFKSYTDSGTKKLQFLRTITTGLSGSVNVSSITAHEHYFYTFSTGGTSRYTLDGYDIEVTPASVTSPVTVQVNSNTVTIGGTESNNASNSLSINFSSALPNISINSILENGGYTAKNELEVFFTENKETSFSLADVSLSNATLKIENGSPVEKNEWEVIETLGGNGSGNGTFDQIWDVFTNGDYIAFADRGNDQVQLFNTSFQFIKSITSGFQTISGIHIANNKLYVSDQTDHKIVIYDLDTDQAVTLGSGIAGSTNADFNFPIGVFVDSSGKLYVADRSNDRVQIFDASLNYESTLSGLSSLQDVIVDETNDWIIVSDYTNGSVHYYDLNTQTFVRSVAGIPFARKITLSLEGNVYAMSQTEGLHVIDQDGVIIKVLEITDTPIGVAFAKSGELIVTRNGSDDWQRIVPQNSIYTVIESTSAGIVTVSVNAGVITDNFNQTNPQSQLTYTYLGTGIQWTGTTSTDWNTATNWSSSSVPTASDDIIVPLQVNQPVISAEATLNNLSVASGATLTVLSGGSLAIMGSATGSVTAKKNLSGNNAYNLIGSPINGMNFTDLDADFAYEWDGTSYSVPSGNLTSGKGYFIAYADASKTLELAGTPNTGQVNVAVTTSGDQFNIVANPYLAAIDRASFVAANTGSIDGNIWLWNDGGSNVGANRGGDYILINNLGVASTIDLGDGISGSKGLPSTNTPITSFQGFLVSATTNANVTFEPTMQTSAAGSNGDGNFYRETSDEKTIVKLSLSNADNYNETLIGLVKGATLGHDYALDGAYRSVNPDFAFYSKMGEQKMAIQALPTNQELPELPLGIELRTAGNYRLQVEEMVNLKGVGVSLKNNLTGEVIALSDHSELALALTAGKNNQYSLVFEPTEVLGIESIAGLRVSGSTERLIVKTDITGTHRTRIFDLSGRNYYDETVTFADGTAELLTSLRAQRVYIIKVQDQSLKFIIK